MASVMVNIGSSAKPGVLRVVFYPS